MPAPSNLIQKWAAEHDISVAGGVSPERLSLTIDRVRVHLVALRSREILVEARVIDLPEAGVQRDKLLERVMTSATARMRDSAMTLTVDANAVSIWLQTRVGIEAFTDQLDQAIAKLVSEVEMWRGVL